jgi:hypothetical protein
MQADPFTETWRIDTVKGRPVGQIELVDIHPLQRRAEVHVCIGERTSGAAVTVRGPSRGC